MIHFQNANEEFIGVSLTHIAFAEILLMAVRHGFSKEKCNRYLSGEYQDVSTDDASLLAKVLESAIKAGEIPSLVPWAGDDYERGDFCRIVHGNQKIEAFEKELREDFLKDVIEFFYKGSFFLAGENETEN